MDTSICEGEELLTNVTQAGMPPYNYVWSNGTAVNGDQNGQASTLINSGGWLNVTLTDAFGFTAEDSILINLLPEPDADFSVTPGTQSVALINTVNTNSAWHWDLGDGTDTFGRFQPGACLCKPRSVHVTLIVTTDCGSDTMSQEVDLRTTSLDEETFAHSVKLVPNPFSDRAQLQFANPDNEAYSLKLFDLKGREVRSYPATRGETFDIQREELPAGIYLFT